MKKISLLVLCLILFYSCRKDEINYDGPGIAEQYSEFKLLQPFARDRDSVDFAAGQKVTFSAKFNKLVNWTITITGQYSNARKILTGISRTIDVTNGTWNGSTTVFPMFRNEPVKAALFIENVQDTFRLTSVIKQIKNNPGVTIADFENGFNTGWVKFIQSGAKMDFTIKSDLLAPQGLKYLNMAGEVNWDWLIGMIDFPASAYGTGNTFPLPSNPDGIYFNCLIYGVQGTNETLVLFQFKEDENGDGTIDPNSDDEYDYQINVNWTGWKLISVKYSDLPCLSNGQPTTPKGNAQHNPDKIGKISMLDLANPADGYASCKIDYIIFTESRLEP